MSSTTPPRDDDGQAAPLDDTSAATPTTGEADRVVIDGPPPLVQPTPPPVNPAVSRDVAWSPAAAPTGPAPRVAAAETNATPAAVPTEREASGEETAPGTQRPVTPGSGSPASAAPVAPTAPIFAAPAPPASATPAHDRAADEPISSDRGTVGEPPAASVPPVQTVYVTAPVPPAKRGNRVFGVLMGVAATIVFAAVFAGLIALILAFVRPQNAFGGNLTGFISNSAFWAPVAVFLVAFILLALMLNRAGWAAWVFASFLLAVVVYFGAIGVILLTEGGLALTADEGARAFGRLAFSAPLIVAAVVAREVTVWAGVTIASRGRRVKAANAEARAEFERDAAQRQNAYASR